MMKCQCDQWGPTASVSAGVQDFGWLLHSLVVINWLNKENKTRLEPLKDNFSSTVILISFFVFRGCPQCSSCLLHFGDYLPLEAVLGPDQTECLSFSKLFSIGSRRFVHCLCSLGSSRFRCSEHLAFLDERSERLKLKKKLQLRAETRLTSIELSSLMDWDTFLLWWWLQNLQLLGNNKFLGAQSYMS